MKQKKNRLKAIQAVLIMCMKGASFDESKNSRQFHQLHGQKTVHRTVFLTGFCSSFPQKEKQITKKVICFSGGDEEDRTLDLTDANRTLSQLSYAPKYIAHASVLVYISAKKRICQPQKRKKFTFLVKTFVGKIYNIVFVCYTTRYNRSVMR